MRLQLLFAAILLSFFGGMAQIPTNLLIKDYKFTNGALTSDVASTLQSGSVNLTQSGTSSTVITDRLSDNNKAVSLNGDFLTSGSTSAVAPNAFAVSFWIKTGTNDSANRCILDQYKTGVDPVGWDVYLRDGKIYFHGQYKHQSGGTSISSIYQEITAPAIISDGNWHHIVCQVNYTSNMTPVSVTVVTYDLMYNYQLFIDDILSGSATTTVTRTVTVNAGLIRNTIDPAQSLVIGKSTNVANAQYNDGIDQVRVYERSLNAAEIHALYIEGQWNANLILVDKNATGLNNGTTWNDAYTDLQTALTNFTSGKSIWVAAGVYKPGNLRATTFSIPQNAQLFGGFTGTEMQLSERNIKNNTTVLSGDLLDNDSAIIQTSDASRQDNAYHVITIKGSLTGIIVDGFTISGGNANGATQTGGPAINQYYHTRGGAIYANTYAVGHILSGNFKNCILEKNTGSDVAVFSPYFASGVNNQGVTINFENCIVRNNYSNTNSQMLYGGASGFSLYAFGTLNNCLFHNNTSVSGASCLNLNASTASGGTAAGVDVAIINSTFSNNTGNGANVMTMVNASNTKIRNSIIYNNGTGAAFAITTTGSVITNSIVTGGMQGGMNSNPLLNPDYTLQSGSPAIDTGNNTYIPSGSILDLNGNSRIVNTTVDMGTFEYDPALSTNDYTTLKNFKIYPNPTNGIITIETTNAIEKIELYTLLGRKLSESNNTQIDLSNLANGIYLLTINTQDGKKGVMKILKN